MVDGDPARMKLASSLILSLPGTPLLLYGEEIGMGDLLELPDRQPVRTPVPWSSLPNAGFSTAPADRLARPLISDGPFDYRQVNVAGQARRPGSLLNWFRQAIAARRGAPEPAWGNLKFTESGHLAVLACTRSFAGGTLLLLHNFAGAARCARFDVATLPCRPFSELRADAEYEETGAQPRTPVEDGRDGSSATSHRSGGPP